jgi:choline kinase
MKAVILTAGQGTRLRPMTADFPKCLIPVNGKPIIQYQLECIEKNGIGECIIVVGFKGEMVERHLGSQFGNTKLIYIKNDWFKETNNIYSLWLARHHLLEDIILLEGDVLFKPHLLEEIQRNPHPNLAVVDKFQSPMNGTIISANSGFATDMILKINQPVDFDYRDALKTVNIYTFSRATLQDHLLPALEVLVSEGQTDQFYERAIAQLIAQGDLLLATHLIGNGNWAEIDELEDLRKAEEIVARWAN